MCGKAAQAHRPRCCAGALDEGVRSRAFSGSASQRDPEPETREFWSDREANEQMRAVNWVRRKKVHQYIRLILAAPAPAGVALQHLRDKALAAATSEDLNAALSASEVSAVDSIVAYQVARGVDPDASPAALCLLADSVQREEFLRDQGFGQGREEELTFRGSLWGHRDDPLKDVFFSILACLKLDCFPPSSRMGSKTFARCRL